MREQMLNKLFEMAKELYGNYTWQKESEIWSTCIEWNKEHEDEEIFMCERCDENNVVDGFYIEDDYFLYEDMMK